MSFGLKIPLHLCKTNGGVVIKGCVIAAFEGGPAGPKISMLTPTLTLDGKMPTALDLTSRLRPGLTPRIGVCLDHSPRDVSHDEAVAVLQGRWNISTLARSYTLAGV